ncbi:ATP-binding protein [Candidatus Gracilibacteria bacterium]|nr:ATP-binding protein [Candidatus Gracilibacteria bacterium]
MPHSAQPRYSWPISAPVPLPSRRLLSPCGGGKTYLAAAIAHAAVAHAIPTLFVVVPDLLDRLRATFRPASAVAYDQLFDQVRSVGLLVLDDLGTEHATPWAREKLYQIVNHRYNHRLATVFTSNVRLEQHDPHIVSRLHDAVLPAQVLTLRVGLSAACPLNSTYTRERTD